MQLGQEGIALPEQRRRAQGLALVGSAQRKVGSVHLCARPADPLSILCVRFNVGGGMSVSEWDK
jgi:hypothetical protein